MTTCPHCGQPYIVATSPTTGCCWSERHRAWNELWNSRKKLQDRLDSILSNIDGWKQVITQVQDENLMLRTANAALLEKRPSKDLLRDFAQREMTLDAQVQFLIEIVNHIEEGQTERLNDLEAAVQELVRKHR